MKAPARGKKIMALVTAVILAAALLCALRYTVAHADHECGGEGVCPICACIQACKKLFDGCAFGSAARAASATLPVFAALFLAGLLFSGFSLFSTVILKTRMND
jgi:hypothetical protein